MLKILLIKTSSLGDLIHTMPAVSDIQQHLPDAELHWLVEESFKEIPYWHPAVKTVHTCAIRRWRKSLFKSSTVREISQLKRTLREEAFDLVIDAQGLLKSAWMLNWLKIPGHGYDKRSIREPLASLFYQNKYSISRELNAIARVKLLFSEALGYPYADPVRFGLHIKKPDSLDAGLEKPFVLFLHGTNWPSKVWPLSYWQSLAKHLKEQKVRVLLPWGNDAEKKVAEAIATVSNAQVLPRLSLTHLAYLLQQADAVIGSDTGLNHIAAALGTYSVGLYGSTSSTLTGLVGEHVINLQSDKDCSPCLSRQCPLITEGEIIPCYASIGPDRVINIIQDILAHGS